MTMPLRQADPRHAAVLADFVRKVVANRFVWVVAGSEGLARRPSPTRRACETTLLWAEQSDAERAAAEVASEPRVKSMLALPFAIAIVLRIDYENRRLLRGYTV